MDSISALNRYNVGFRFVPRDFNFLRVKQIVRVSQLISSARRQAPSDCAAPVSHGHAKADAQRIRALVEEAQGTLNLLEKLKLS
jgi:hypothetical protein